jgi:hypothetical protein
MKFKYVFFLFVITCTMPTFAQKFDYLSYQKSGTFSKPSIVKNMKQIAIAQNTIFFKQISTMHVVHNERNVIGGRKSGGATVKAKVSAYLEFSDEEPTMHEYQQLTDYFNKYLNNKLHQAGIPVVEWNIISTHKFYKEHDKEAKEETQDMNLKKEQGYYKFNANAGNTILNYRPYGGLSLGFAMGRSKRAADFTDDLSAAVLYMHTVVDFCDLELNAKITNKKQYGFYEITHVKKYKVNGSVGPNIKIAGEDLGNGSYNGGRLHFASGMKQDQYLNSKDIPSNVTFATEIIQDPSKMNKKRPVFGVSYGKKMDLVPVAIVTTKANYLSAVKKSLEQYADKLVADMVELRK